MTETTSSAGRPNARVLSRGLILAGGIGMIVGAVLAPIALTTKVLFILLGMLVYEAGVWRIADWFLPETRKYLALRKETDYFLGLVRELNRAAVQSREGVDTDAEIDQVREAMVNSVERLVHYAGKTPRQLNPTAIFDIELQPGTIQPDRR